jgi:hypothetical protein
MSLHNILAIDSSDGKSTGTTVKPYPVESSKDPSVLSVKTYGELKYFYKVPFDIYKGDKNWVAPFWIEFKEFFNEKNPFWTHAKYKLFIVYKDQKIVGRIAAIIDDLYCKTQDEKIGFFGFFECIDDFDCAKSLFQSAERWLSSQGMILMRGPIDGRIDVGCGFLYEGFDLPVTLLSSYSLDYYISFCKRYNMEKSRDFFEYYIDLTKPLPDELQEKANQCSENGVMIRPFKRFRTNNELQWWVTLFLETFEKHWGYVPVTEKEVKLRFGVKQLRWTVDSRLFLIAEYNGSPIAYLWATPEYNQIFRNMNGRLGFFGYASFFLNKKRINVGKLHIIGIKENLRHKNIGSFLNYKVLEEMRKRSYLGAVVGSIDENNKNAHSTIKLTGARIYRKFRVFEKKIETSI